MLLRECRVAIARYFAKWEIHLSCPSCFDWPMLALCRFVSSVRFSLWRSNRVIVGCCPCVRPFANRVRPGEHACTPSYDRQGTADTPDRPRDRPSIYRSYTLSSWYVLQSLCSADTTLPEGMCDYTSLKPSSFHSAT